MTSEDGKYDISPLAGSTDKITSCSYQERYLAYRKVFFFNDFVIFECPKATYRGNMHYLNAARFLDVAYLRESLGATSPERESNYDNISAK